MPLSSNIHSYDDVRAVLDAALEAGGGVYTLDSPGQAVYWRARAYYYRKLLRDLAAERAVPGIAPSTPYDHMKLALERGSPKVVIEIIKPQGRLTTMEGEPLDVKMGKVVDEDENALFEEAERLKNELGLD